jgi:hypothetical protein
MNQLPKPQKGEFRHFGHVLRSYRETIGKRLQQYSPGLAPIQASAQEIIKCLRSQDYQISAGTYSALENGDSLPRDPETFIDKISHCLAIERKSLEWWTLTLYVMYGLAAQKLGNTVADEVIPISPAEISKICQESQDHAEQH